jgi:hypothetical protein
VSDLDRKLDLVVRHQHGAFSRAQAVALGFTRRMVELRIATGAWLVLDHAVYALASHPFTWERQAMAATLSVEGAVLSGRSAAALHGIDGFRKGSLEIAAGPRRGARSELARVRRLEVVHSSVVDHIPTLDVADTILHLASSLSAQRLERAIDEVIVRRFVTVDELQQRSVRFGGRRGSAVVRALLLERGPGAPTPPRNDLERALRALTTGPGLPTFFYEVEMPWWPLGEGRVDAYSPECRLILEADGRAWHTRQRDFAKDRRRDNLATANGHVVLRFTYDDLMGRRVECHDLVRKTALGRGWRSSP